MSEGRLPEKPSFKIISGNKTRKSGGLKGSAEPGHRGWAKNSWKKKNPLRGIGPLKFSSFLPNLVTLASLSMGLSAIRFAMAGEWKLAVASILIAGFLDGVDGRLARMLKVSSEFGAELDSLADFVNFGVAPCVVVYSACLPSPTPWTWSACLFFATCMALRLARFNIQRHTAHASLFSVGVPAPAGALLALTPLIWSFVFEVPPYAPICTGTMIIIAGLLISRYPTFVPKKLVIPHHYRGLFMVSCLGILTSLISAPWETLLLMAFLYIVSFFFSGYLFYKKGLS